MNSVGRAFAIFAIDALLANRAATQVLLDRDPAGGFGPNWLEVSPAAPPTPESAANPRGFQILLSLPVVGTTNALGRISENSGQRGQPDVHFNPDLLLKWTHQLDHIRLSASLDISTDRFAIHSDQDTDAVFGSVKASLTDGKSDFFVPYAYYSGTADFVPIFARREDTLNDFAVGLSSGIGISATGRLMRFRDSTHTGDGSLAFDIALGRRLADPADLRASFVVASADLVYNATPDLILGITPKLRLRSYDNFLGSRRHDVRIGFLARAEWTPEWLTRLTPGAELDATIEFAHNFSTLSTANYGLWEVGPTLMSSWQF